MEQSLPPAELFKRFISWQCRLRKKCVRELGGQPSVGMSAGVYSVGGDEEKSRLNFLIVKQEPAVVTTEFAHIIRKTLDSRDWLKNGLRILSERHYQDDLNFANQLTALFNLESALADALMTAGQCQLKFKQDSIEFVFDFDVIELDEQDDAHQATYWHNHLFNPSLPGKVRVLGLSPRL
ncbi:MAG: hypothetical protein ACI9KN_002401 [Gammaproteobacteria bacterium]|jgi:hypothetical protein